MNNNIPPITKNLLIINVLCFFGAIVAERYGIDADKVLSLHFFMASDFNMGQLVTYMFMHGGFTHIFSICLLFGCSDVCWSRFGGQRDF